MNRDSIYQQRALALAYLKALRYALAGLLTLLTGLSVTCRRSHQDTRRQSGRPFRISRP